MPPTAGCAAAAASTAPSTAPAGRRSWRNAAASGSAVLTTAGRLPAGHVIHAVGPRWHGGGEGEAELLAGAYRTSLRVAVEAGLRTVAFPSISTGAYGYPIADAARVAMRAVGDFVRENPGKLDLVRFVLFSAADYAVYAEALAEALGA
jgi:O-acetyl-ADP-ribose deacetylase (regulator of RNase III)